MKTCSDCWVVGKKSDQREFYVVINQHNASLIEINEEVKRLCASHFNSIFFLDKNYFQFLSSLNPHPIPFWLKIPLNKNQDIMK